jgi:D-alanyl-lipoteichoic acid acyltransferase DltB (MBOAT superfamily)
MAFNTFQYLAFFVSVLVIASLLIGHPKPRFWFLLGASFYFYASNNRWQTLLIFFTVTVDYLICRRLAYIEDDKTRRRLVVVSIASNLGILAYFKYANFLGHSLSIFAESLGFKLDWVTWNIALPIGISFYTFEALSYTIDVYRRKISPEGKWSRLAFLVTFFPHLIAGPIVRAADFLPQIGRRPRLTASDCEWAFLKIAGGLIKKMILADSLAPFADLAFDHPAAAGTAGVWLGVYAFAFQIFFDFSGYADIAVGCAKLLGYQLPENFLRPYAAVSITDFWRRWHITLSTWLRDYLYIPLGGNRMKTKWGIYRNLLLTMLLGGLWHGAAWTFVIWGGLHGLYLVLERALGGVDRSPTSDRFSILSRFIIFHLVVFTWIPFRSKTVLEACQMLGLMFSKAASPPLTRAGIAAALVILGGWLWQIAGERLGRKEQITKFTLPVKSVIYSFLTAAALFIAGMHVVDGNKLPKTFIYFRF